MTSIPGPDPRGVNAVKRAILGNQCRLVNVDSCRSFHLALMKLEDHAAPFLALTSKF